MAIWRNNLTVCQFMLKLERADCPCSQQLLKSTLQSCTEATSEGPTAKKAKTECR